MVIVANDLNKALRPLAWLVGFAVTRLQGNYLQESINQAGTLLAAFDVKFEVEKNE